MNVMAVMRQRGWKWGLGAFIAVHIFALNHGQQRTFFESDILIPQRQGPIVTDSAASKDRNQKVGFFDKRDSKFRRPCQTFWRSRKVYSIQELFIYIQVLRMLHCWSGAWREEIDEKLLYKLFSIKLLARGSGPQRSNEFNHVWQFKLWKVDRC